MTNGAGAYRRLLCALAGVRTHWVSEDLERRLAVAEARVRGLSEGLSRATMQAWREAREQQLQAERDLAAARGEQYAKVIDIGPRWDAGAPLPHLVTNGSRTLVACLADQPDPSWDGTWARLVSPSDEAASLTVLIELWGCAEVRFGGPNDDALHGHPLHGKGLSGYRAHEVVNSAWRSARDRRFRATTDGARRQVASEEEAAAYAPRMIQRACQDRWPQQGTRSAIAPLSPARLH